MCTPSTCSLSFFHPQALSSLGLPSTQIDSNRNQELDLILILNNMYDLLQLHQFAMGGVEEQEVVQLKVRSPTLRISCVTVLKKGPDAGTSRLGPLGRRLRT